MASAPGRVWPASITSIPTGGGWLHLSAVLDVATGTIVGWAMRDPVRDPAGPVGPVGPVGTVGAIGGVGADDGAARGSGQARV